MHGEDDFQLLEARTADVPVEMPWRRERPYINPNVVFNLVPQPLLHQREHITAVIGKNGTGKSHLLSSIVKTFVALEQLKSGKRKSRKPLGLKYLAYRMDNQLCEMEQDQGKPPLLRVDGIPVSPLDVPLPRRVVALTISPFDKFPVPRTLPYSVAPSDPSIYHYLGLRDNFGKASIETLLYRSLNTLFDTSDNEAMRRGNIGAVFDFLKLKPTVNVIYKLRAGARLIDAVKQGSSLNDPDVLSPTQKLRVEEVERSGVSERQLLSLLQIAFDRAVYGRIETRADFEAGGLLDEFFRDLQPIRRAGFLNLSGVEVTLKSGLSSDLRSASSGQLGMVSALVALASVISNGSLILIDEPEISLHPEWQIKYIDLLVRTFARYRGCHFIVATHSPLVVSELPSHATVMSLDKDMQKSGSDFNGRSADYLLAMAFDLPSNGNLYVKDRIVEALRLVANGRARSEEFGEIVTFLNGFVEELSDDDPSKAVINNLQNVADHAGRSVAT